MKISSLEIDGYGVWSGLQVERLSDGLSVIYGPNEAGKTTLLQFIRSMLYGFSAQRRRYLPPVHGGQPGGRIEVTGPNGRFQVERSPDAGQDGAEQITITAADGTRQGEHMLRVFLANLDEAIFNNVFAVGLREIQELGALSDTEAAQLLYNITAGLDRVSLVEVLRELETSRNRILDRGGGPCQVQQLLAERERLRGEIEDLDGLYRRWARLAAERGQLDREINCLEEECNLAEHQLRVLDLAVSLRDRWRQRAALDTELAALGPRPPMPHDAIRRLDALKAHWQKLQDRIARTDHEREDLRQEAAALEVHEPLGRQAARIEALLEQEPWIKTVEGQVASLEREIAELQAALFAEYEQLGLAAPQDPENLPRLSARAVSRVRLPAKAARNCQERFETAQREAAAANDLAASLDGQIHAGLPEDQGDLAAATQRAGNLVAQLRRRIQVDERIDQMTRYRAELEDQSHGLLDRQVLPVGILAGLGAVFVLGLVLLLAGTVMPASMTGSLGWAFAIFGLAAAVTAVAAKVVLERSNTRQLDACQKQLRMLQLQIQQAKDEGEVLDGQLPRGGGPMVSRLAAAERDLAALEELAPLEARRTAARQEAAAAAQRAAQAEQDLKAARRRWREGLAEAGLPATLVPRQVRRIARSCNRLDEMQRRLAERRAELTQRRREREMLVGRIAQLVAECGVEVSAAGPLEQLRQLADALTRQQAQIARRETIRRRLRQLRRLRIRQDEAIRRLKQRRRGLFHECGVEDEPQLRQRAVESARAESLLRDREAADREIAAAVGDRCSQEALRQQLEGDAAAGLEARREEAAARLAVIQRELRERIEKRGQLAQEMKTLADDRQLANKQLDLAVLEKRLENALHRWRVLAVTGRILETIRATYEHERQPETLREASGYLDRLTQGRYRRVWTPLGEPVLRVDDAEGRSLAVEQLSRGTREQLFLSLRLALAAFYARHGAPLPLVLDDVLVNFDAQRAEAAAAVLRDFGATGHQLLVFTCHEHIARLFQSLKIPVGALPNNAEGPHAPLVLEEPAVATPEKPKRPRKAAAAAPRSAGRSRPPVVEPEDERIDEPNDEMPDSSTSESVDEAHLWEGEDDEEEPGSGDEFPNEDAA